MMSTKDRGKELLRRRCWHEAGHAVVAWLLGHRLSWIKAKPGGWIKVQRPNAPGDCDVAIIALAGRFAAAKSGIKLEIGWSDNSADRDKAIGSLRDHFGDDWQLPYEHAQREAERLVKENIERIERLASALESRLRIKGHDEVVAIIEKKRFLNRRARRPPRRSAGPRASTC